MLYRAAFDTVSLSDGQMEYVRFGTGSRYLVMLPGLGDSLRSMKGTSLPLAILYRAFARDFTVYIFSRKSNLLPGCTTRDLAQDLALAMEKLGITRADIFGVSMGGMIAQHLAVDYPGRVNKLVLAVTAARPNPILTASLQEWIALAQKGDHTAFMESNLRRIYSQDYYRKNRWLLPILGRMTKPASYQRFFVQADACLTHDAYVHLTRIAAPTLVIGGEQDLTLGGDPSREIASRIPGSILKMYPQWGHGLYEEARDFIPTILAFLTDLPISL